ncbi:hypothetical protein VDR21_04890 [Xanthomonas campestris pv. campestris]|nr:hypothetical protein [Xanthomonas campestris pv. campestris]MEB1863568.1 hypothetical protein [Xanthomonas campestris pv. campestris]
MMVPDLDDATLLAAERQSLDEAVVLLQECWGVRRVRAAMRGTSFGLATAVPSRRANKANGWPRWS